MMLCVGAFDAVGKRVIGRSYWLGFVVVAVAAGGCATTPRVGDSPAEREKAVAQRAEARWGALIKGDLDAAYTYLSPGSKVANPLSLYKTKVKPGIWREAKTESVKCEGDACTATMSITYDYRRTKGIKTQLTENWIIEDGTAWYVYR